MAAIAEQEKLRNINMEKQLQAQTLLNTVAPSPHQVHDLQLALLDRDK